MTTAFLAVVLGPVLLGAFFVAGTVATISRHQSEDRLNLAAGTVRTSISALCQQLHATAGAVALLADPTSRAGAATEMVARGLAGAVLITDPAGVAAFVTPGAPPRPWVSCAGPAATDSALRALAVRVELRDRLGAVVGAVWAAQVLDAAFVRRLAAASGTAVTLMRGGPEPAETVPGAGPLPHSPPPPNSAPPPVGGTPPGIGAPPDLGPLSAAPPAAGPRSGTSSGPGSPGVGPAPGEVPPSGAAPGGVSPSGAVPGVVPPSGPGHPSGAVPTADAGSVAVESPEMSPEVESQSTESTSARAGVLEAARRISGDMVVRAEGGRYVRRVGPSPGQPLPLVLSVPRNPPTARYGSLGIGVLLAGALAALAAWRLARSTTRPLAELARAADRVADGDLAARVPVRAPDEVGRLADSFNRMTRDTQSYLRALVISRHQLRDQLSVLGDTLASTHDLHRIFQVILRTAMAATGARAGVVLLLDPGTGILVSQCAEGLDGREPRQGSPAGGDRPGHPGQPELRVPLGGGLLGTVAATREPRRGRLDRDGPPLYAHEPHCRTYVAVPFSAPAPVGTAVAQPSGTGGGTLPLRPAAAARFSAGALGSGAWYAGMAGSPAAGPGDPQSAVGVLALYDRLGSDEFDDADLVTLGTFAGHAAVAVDNVRVHEEAQRLSLTDPLTGLWNYRYLKESVRREIERASRFGRMLSVLALDLDRFKEVNDTYGHAAGDAVLAEFAARIRGAMREVDLAFRQGGEEFVVLLPETDARGAATVAERLGAAVRETPIAIRPRPGVIAPVRAQVSVTVSVGVAVYPDHAATGPQLLVAADEALYAAKAAGRDTYRVATPGGRPVSEEIPVRVGAASPDDGLPWAGDGSARSSGAERGPGGVWSGRGPGGVRPDRGSGGERSDQGSGGVRSTPPGRAGGSGPVDAGSGPDGALSGPQPPRQVRGR
ncbi:diguanylate cyclase [Plantactinospora solaniradicis]|uniref:Diguanylate cyclase n=1 Tax=Plantactinospora solaniradicis TaxID=1723736 RepID=A0ABW1K031_9ACTN